MKIGHSVSIAVHPKQRSGGRSGLSALRSQLFSINKERLWMSDSVTGRVEKNRNPGGWRFRSARDPANSARLGDSWYSSTIHSTACDLRNQCDFSRLQAFWRVRHLELDGLARHKISTTVLDDLRIMNEDIPPAIHLIRLDEAIPFRVTKPLYFSLCHSCLPQITGTLKQATTLARRIISHQSDHVNSIAH